jgi:hypothetical protein
LAKPNVRDFAQPRVLKLAAIAAFISSLLCYPRLAGWSQSAYPVWVLEGTVFCCALVLWGFVFAWHTRYAHRDVVTLRIEPKWITIAALTGCVVAALLYLFLDPAMRKLIPEDFPTNFDDWLAKLLFGLGLTQLFLVFAPFDWLMRLCKRPQIATVFTIIFGIIVLVLKIHSSKAVITPLLFSALICSRMITSYLAIQLYLRGGLFLVSWFTLIVETRYLLNLK